MTEPERRIAALETVIATAIALIEAGERGSALRLLKTGNFKPPVSGTGVLTTGGK